MSNQGGQYDYVFVKPEGNKGLSFKHTGRQRHFSMPPGVSGTRVFLQVAGILALCAIPVWGMPYITGRSAEEAEKQAKEKPKEDFYTLAKQRQREQRMKWVTSDEMPPK